MDIIGLERIPTGATGVWLWNHVRETACEKVMFMRESAVNTVLRRAAIAGRVEVEPWEGDPDFTLDVLDQNGDILIGVALDRGSYRALKYRWARCKNITDAPAAGRTLDCATHDGFPV